jgi:NhaA family Na+:H+ antiporter
MKKPSKTKVIVTTLVNTILLPFNEFIKFQQASGVLLLAATAVSLLWANSAAGHSFIEFWEKPFALQIGDFTASSSVLHFVNDGLMTLFFVVVGLEIKREIMEGELSTRQKAVLPVLAAVGGMVVPALFFAMFNFGRDTQHGWGIPMATDIAFSLTILSLLGTRVPAGLKIFLAALAIVDDLGAILVIALFYSSNLNLEALLWGLAAFGGLMALNVARVHNMLPYFLLGALLWTLFLKSGIHPTIAGVLFAASVPHRRRGASEPKVEAAVQQLEKQLKMLQSPDCRQDKMLRDQVLEEMQVVSSSIESPLQNLLHSLHPFSSYVIMPLFALANAAIVFGNITADEIVQPLGLGILVGLVLGKPLGITFAAWIGVKAGLAVLPNRVSFTKIYGMGCLAGIGFTMSIFIANLALRGHGIELAKGAVLLASGIAAISGYLVLLLQSMLARRPDLQKAE